ncbi:hypothetical protein, partial [Frankia sp. AgW1.1]|uniref:hypothetical protein n=1 Tax=Frankia sp. AgW1.1 TaxID=1836971 RepID=UPI001EE4106F
GRAPGAAERRLRPVWLPPRPARRATTERVALARFLEPARPTATAERVALAERFLEPPRPTATATIGGRLPTWAGASRSAGSTARPDRFPRPGAGPGRF